MKPTSLEREKLVAELIAAREAVGVSKSQIARAAGVSPTCIFYQETCYLAMSPRSLRAYAELCGLDADRLLLSWGYTPPDVLAALQQHPEWCALVRAA